jgi:hypothetical protein
MTPKMAFVKWLADRADAKAIGPETWTSASIPTQDTEIDILTRLLSPGTQVGLSRIRDINSRRHGGRIAVGLPLQTDRESRMRMFADLAGAVPTWVRKKSAVSCVADSSATEISQAPATEGQSNNPTIPRAIAPALDNGRER